MRRQANPRHDGNGPFRGAVLVPLDRVPVVHGELMVQVVIAFADSDECGDHVVLGSVLVIERRLTEPVRVRTSITEVPLVAFRELSRPERP